VLDAWTQAAFVVVIKTLNNRSMPFRRIAVGLDFLSPSLAAARFAVQRLCASEFVFVHVLPDRPEYIADPLTETRHAQFRLREIARALDVTNPDFDVVRGSVLEELCLAAQYVEADLLCIGTTSRKGPTPISDEARAIVRRSSVSTLIVPTQPGAGPVYAAWSGEDGAIVLRTAALIARKWGVELNALCVITEAAWSAGDPDGIEQRQLAAILQQARDAGVATVRVDVQASAADTIDSLIRFVRRKRGGMLVCDAAIAATIIDCDVAATTNDEEMSRLLGRLPILTVASPPRPDGIRRPRRHASRAGKASIRRPKLPPKPPPDGGDAA